MKIIFTILFVLIGAVVSYQLYQLYSQRVVLQKRFNVLDQQTANLSKENQQVKDNLQYYQDPENLAKELKSKFDYKRPGEELYVIVPKR